MDTWQVLPHQAFMRILISEPYMLSHDPVPSALSSWSPAAAQARTMPRSGKSAGQPASCLPNLNAKPQKRMDACASGGLRS